MIYLVLWMTGYGGTALFLLVGPVYSFLFFLQLCHFLKWILLLAFSSWPPRFVISISLFTAAESEPRHSPCCELSPLVLASFALPISNFDCELQKNSMIELEAAKVWGCAYGFGWARCCEIWGSVEGGV
ncbi:hypothetical protein Droror1_Dr00005554 [Drosera rotundifolia]